MPCGEPSILSSRSAAGLGVERVRQGDPDESPGLFLAQQVSCAAAMQCIVAEQMFS